LPKQKIDGTPKDYGGKYTRKTKSKEIKIEKTQTKSKEKRDESLSALYLLHPFSMNHIDGKKLEHLVNNKIYKSLWVQDSDENRTSRLIQSL